MGKPSLAAGDASQALNIMCKARCVTEFPKPEEELQRRRLRLYARRATAYALAGALHRASADLHQAAILVGGSRDPCTISDAQMIQEDLEAVGRREEAAAKAREAAAGLMEAHRPREGVDTKGGEAELGAEAIAGLGRALFWLDECVALQASDAPTLASRAACLLWLGEARRSITDATAGIEELEIEDKRTEADTAMLTGMFPALPPPEHVAAALKARAAAAPGVRFELFRIRAAARQRIGMLAAAADDLKVALRLRPGDARVILSLDGLARRAAAEGVELDPLPAAPPPMPELPVLTEAGEDLRGEGEGAGDGEGGGAGTGAEAGAGAGADGGVRADVGAPPAAINAGKAGGSRGPPAVGKATGTGGPPAVGKAGRSGGPPAVGTRTAAQIKFSADSAVAAGRLQAAVKLYSEALTADASAEWLQSVAVGGLLFRCQCLANRAACHLRLKQHAHCVDDAGAALAALGGGGTDMAARELGGGGTDVAARGLGGGGTDVATRGLRLKLLARRGMALCQMMRYGEAAEDYAAAVEMDPGDEQLRHDLAAIQAARDSCK
jgi:tetratricopeptide (TPR) repeat protein